MTFLALFQNPIDFVVKGGVFMWILLVCSFVAITVILLRLIALRKGAVIPRLIEKSIVGYRSGKVWSRCADLLKTMTPRWGKSWMQWFDLAAPRKRRR